MLSDSQLADIAKEYMDKLGYGNQPYMVYKHEDIARHHVHIVSIRVDDTGKKINDKFEHVRSKQITRELEQKYGLHPAEKKQATERPELKKVDYRAGGVKHQFIQYGESPCQQLPFPKFYGVKALLSIYNVQAEEVKGEVNGKPYNGIVYSATNDKGEKQGNPFKSSSLGKSVGYEAIQRHIKKSAKDIQDKNLKERIRRTVAAVIQSAHSREQLITELKAKGIDVLFRQNDTGRIYGVTFIDHESRTVLNGSRLGKDFSANVFNELFNNPDADRTRLIPPPEQDTPRPEQDTKERLERKEYRQQENQGYQSELSGSLIDTSALGAIDIFSLLMEDDHTHEYIDPAFRFGRRKKKKRRRKL